MGCKIKKTTLLIDSTYVENSFFMPDMVRVVMLSMRPADPGGRGALNVGGQRTGAGIAGCGGVRVSRNNRTIRVAFRTWGGRG